MPAPSFKWPQVQYSLTRLGASFSGAGVSPGGLDLTTPSLALQPGALRAAANFECAQAGGYSRIGGYERVDGHAAPSAASYTIVQLASFASVPSVGDAITQATSGAGGTVAAVYNGGDATYLVVTKTSGTFDGSHDVSVGATLIGTATATTVSISGLLNAQYLADAADIYRADILAVPGSGKVLGVFGMTFGGVTAVYAFRANAGGTAVDLYKTTATGWSQVPFFNTVAFTLGGAAEPADGETLTQGGVSATIKRVVWASGAWTGDAAGVFVVTNPTGGHFAAGAATTSGGATITLSGAEAAITLNPGGRYQIEKCNFSGQLATKRAYGCDGVNKCFEFDGETYAPITTGLTTDAPTWLTFHNGYLFVAKDSSILHSGPGTPFKWDAVDGGEEIATGDEVVGMLSMTGAATTAALFVFCKNKTSILYGTDPTNFIFVTFNAGIGGTRYSGQNLMDGFVFNKMGTITLRTTLNYGNFNSGALNKNIMPFVQDKHTKVSASCVSQTKSQYRVFFSDGYGLYVTVVNQQYLGSVPVFFPNPVYCMDVAEDASGNEVIYFGSSDENGYVYQLDIGTSFDGADLPAYITLAWDAIKSPRILKRFRAASIEIQASTYTQIAFGYQLGYGSPNIGQPNPVNYSTSFSEAPHWDSFTWDNFVWDGVSLSPTEIDVTGTGENIQVTLSSDGNYIGAFTVNSVIYHHTPRRGLRP